MSRFPPDALRVKRSSRYGYSPLDGGRLWRQPCLKALRRLLSGKAETSFDVVTVYTSQATLSSNFFLYQAFWKQARLGLEGKRWWTIGGYGEPPWGDAMKKELDVSSSASSLAVLCFSTWNLEPGTWSFHGFFGISRRGGPSARCGLTTSLVTTLPPSKRNRTWTLPSYWVSSS